jgi:type IV secretory pathway VirB4 component
MPNKASFGNSQSLVEIEAVKDGVLILKTGEMRRIVMVGGLNFALKSESEQNLITQSYQEFLNSLSFPIQILVHSRKINIEKYLATLDARRSEEKSGLLQDQISEYQEFIRSFVSDNAIMEKTFFVVIPFAAVALPSTDTLTGFLPFFKKSEAQQAQAKTAADTSFEEAKAQLAQRVSQVVEGLTIMGLDAEPLEDEAIVELFYNFYNPGSVEKDHVPMRPNG